MSNKVLGNLKKGLVFVMSAPAGTGKTTLMKKLSDEFPCVVQSVSYTTRDPRPGELPGRDYHFVSLADFRFMIERNEFLEHVKLYGHHYGTSRKWVEEMLNKGKHVILVIDTQGGLQLKEQGFKAVYIFVTPPSLQELERRLEYRSTETDSDIEERLQWAVHELEQGKKYDYHIINDNIDVAYEILKSILIAEENRTSVRQIGE